MLDYVLQFEGEARKAISKIVEYELYLLAHKRSGFDIYVLLNNLLQLRTVVSSSKNGLGIVSPKMFNGYVDQNIMIPQYVHFTCGLLPIKDSSK